jgi:DNA repair protein RadC
MIIKNRAIKKAIKQIQEGKTQEIDLEIMEVIKAFNLGELKKEEYTLNSVEKTVNFCRTLIEDDSREYFFIIFLSANLQFLGHKTLFTGTIDQASIYPREVIKETLNQEAKQVILIHNHPSKNLRPSQADLEMTKKVQNFLEIIEVRTLDHVIISKKTNSYYSFLEEGIL